MRGIERRTEGPQRRASDKAGAFGHPLERAVLLSILLVLAMAVFMIVRDQSRPQREINNLQRDALVLEARLLANDIEQLLGQMTTASQLSANRLSNTGTRPLDALEAGLASTGLGSANVRADMALYGANGELIARKGDNALPEIGVSLKDDQIYLGRKLPDGRTLSISTPLPATVASSSDVRLQVRYANQLPAGVFSKPEGVHLLAPDGGPRLTVAVPIGQSGLSVTADRPGLTVFERWIDDAGLLALPLLAGIALLGGLAYRTMRMQRTTRKWEDNERRFRVAVEAARCGVWEWDMRANRIALSDYMAELLEVESGSVLTAEQFIDRVHPQFREAFVAAIERARTEGQFEIAFPVPLLEGGVRWIDARGRSPQRDRGRAPLQMLGVALDITEARLAKARAQAAETRLIDGIQSVTDAFVLFDRHGRLLLWNDAFQDAFGFAPGFLKRGAQKQHLNRIAAQAIQSEQQTAQRRPGVREVLLKDGRWLQMTERYTGDGGTVVIAADVTAIRNQEAERRHATEELQRTVHELESSRAKLASLARQYEEAMTRAEAASQSKSEFLANMSHELRTPLNAINGFSEIMAGEMFGPLGDARYKGYAQDILNSGRHLLSLINDILDMAKIEAGKLSLHYERTDLSALGRDVVRLMRGRAEEAGLALVLEAPEVIDAEVDTRGIKQVLLNLVSNAVKFTPRAGRVMLGITPLSDKPGFVRIAVTDTGIGIAPDDVRRLGQPFVQVENQHAKTTQGTGLGLALTKSLIEMHGSSMVIESEPGRGTNVYFDLPLNAHTDTDAPRIEPIDTRFRSHAA